MRNYSGDSFDPWRLVLPLACAIALGTLMADGVRLIFARIALERATAQVQDAIKEMPQASGQGPEFAQPESVPLPVYAPPRSDAPEGEYACSGGILFQRLDNGWVQRQGTGNRPACRSSSR